MTHDLLVLHAVRIGGFVPPTAIAGRFGLSIADTEATLGDFEDCGWVQHAMFADLSGWSLTTTGRAENERQLAAELDHAGAREPVAAAYRRFLPVNAMLLSACTDWQLRPTLTDPLAANDHTDREWDAGVLGELTLIDRALAPLVNELSDALPRFTGYDTRFSTALRRAHACEHGWVDRTDIDSCHRVWFELHEDLIATLGIDRHAR